MTSSATYTMFLEYLGGLVPLLKGKRVSKLRPEFVIFDPQSLGIVRCIYFFSLILFVFIFQYFDLSKEMEDTFHR